MLIPEYIFETSWEVCNRVGGIYTVLSTKAASMRKEYGDKVIFFGPELWTGHSCPFFKEDKTLLADWRKAAKKEGLSIRVGRWTIPGEPIAVLIDFNALYAQKDAIYGHLWQQFGVDSIQAYGDYDEASMFGYATGIAMESFYRFYHLEGHKVVAHFNEWMTAFGLFYVKEHLPQVGTLFTTHATSIGRSIAGNDKPLYDYFSGYHGDQMARELNMVSKQSVEKQAAHHADCFTTVSYITDKECAQLLEKPADVATPNGFEGDFVPKGAKLTAARKKARSLLRRVTEKLLDYKLNDNALFVCTSGRYEFKNKGIDVVLRVASLLNKASYEGNRQIVFFLAIPAWQCGPRQDLQRELLCGKPLLSWNRVTTHELVDYSGDKILNSMRYYGLNNLQSDRVKVVFIPSYLNGDDGIFNCSYYDLLVGMDLTLFPSYYEPWGYTPLESVAFHVPTVTTNVSGFGQWATRFCCDVADGVGVVERTDSNWDEMCNNVANQVREIETMPDEEVRTARKKAADIAEKALWKHFFQYYQEAYDIALSKKQ